MKAQLARMAELWPDFKAYSVTIGGDSKGIGWRGPLRAIQKVYTVQITHHPNFDRPQVRLLSPQLKTRDDRDFDEIPHLVYDAANPAASWLCLYDPDGGEWNDTLLIAETTVKWTAEWLRYYELWHYDGVWRGGGVGGESVGEARIKAIHAKASEHAPDSAQQTAVAARTPV